MVGLKRPCVDELMIVESDEREIEVDEEENNNNGGEYEKFVGIMNDLSLFALPVPDPNENATMDIGFSSTTQVEDNARVSFQSRHKEDIDVDEKRKVTNEGLELGYCVIPSDKRLIVLYSFLRRNQTKKIMVVFSSSESVIFHSELFRCNEIDCFVLHGRQNQYQRATAVRDFCKAEKGILLCIDLSLRGLDTPGVDWIVQYDPPYSPKDYVRTVGQITQNKEAAKGNSLLFLLSEEKQYLRDLKREKVSVKAYGYDTTKLDNVQSHLENLVKNNSHLKKSAKDACSAFILTYLSQDLKDVFDVRLLKLKAVVTSFCLSRPSDVRKTIINKKRKLERRIIEAERGGDDTG